MRAPEIERAVAAATEIASALGLPVADATVVHNSNKLAVRLLPCDVFVRVALAGQEVFERELEIARRLAEIESPVARLEPRLEPRVYEHGGFALTFWTCYEQAPHELAPGAYAAALEGLHAGMATLDVAVPHFTERIAEAQQLVSSGAPALGASDRELLSSTLRRCAREIAERRPPEQLLHGEPHSGNLLNTPSGPLFIDLETCCRGPVEFDLAHVPEEVCRRYSGADPELLRLSHGLVLAMVAAWRCDPGDQFPEGERARQELLGALRAGPPWPTLDAVMR